MLWEHFYNPNVYSMVKTMAYPIFIDIAYFLHIKYTLLISFIWIVDAFLVYKILKEITKNKWVSSFFYVYTLFMFSAFDQWTGTRMYRNSIIAPFVLLTICLIIELILNIKNNRISYKTVIISIALGLIFTFTYYIKEDGIWLMACLLFVTLINILLLIYRRKTKNKEKMISRKEFIAFLITLSIPLIIFEALTIAYKAINYHFYGVYATETKSGGNLGKFNNLIYKIKSPNRTSTVWAPYDAIEQAFEVSDTLKKYPELKDNIMHSVWCQNDIKNNPIKGDFLTWVLRESLIETEIWETEEQIDKLFEQVNNEIKSAFDSGKLEKDNKIQLLASAGGRSISEIKDLIKYTVEGLTCNINLDGYIPAIVHSYDTDIETLEVYRKKAGEKLDCNQSAEVLKNDEKHNFIMSIIFKIYSITNIICFAVTIFIIIVYIIKYISNIKDIKNYINNEMFQLCIILILLGITIVYIFAIMWFAEFIMGQENEKRLITFYTIAAPSLMVFPYAISINLLMENIKKIYLNYNKKGANK